MNATSHPLSFPLPGRRFIACCLLTLTCHAADKRINPTSPCGLCYYCQGGVVVDGVAYVTATDHSRLKDVKRTADAPAVVAFDVNTFQKIRTYDFTFTYDSTPLVFQRKDGAWLVVAHEHKKARTKALFRDNGKLAWTSEANQPGAYFFGYSYFVRGDGSKLLLLSCKNGLHALSGETGEDVWWVERRSKGGVTPCVDQGGGLVYYQCDGKVLKIRATDGEVLKEVPVESPNVCISWNTVLVDDAHGRYVATRWYGKPEWDSALRVYDTDLKLLWEQTGLPHGKKDTLTYVDGKLICGSGNCWSKEYSGDTWKTLAAYAIADGEIAWQCDLSKYGYRYLMNLPCLNGYLYGETSGAPQPSKLLRLNAANGKLEEVYDYGRPISSCATHFIAHGKVFSGDLFEDRMVVTRIAEGSTTDWPGPFGDPQTNQMVAPRDPAAKLVPMEEVGRETLSLPGNRVNLARQATITAQSRIRGEQREVGRMVDGDVKTWWSTGPGDLALLPVDVVVKLDAPRCVDTLILATSALKGMLRLKDMDVYAGLGDTWDGAHPLARVRDNEDKTIRVTFPTVRLDRIRLRLLGTHRPDNAFAHIAELAVHPAKGEPRRTIEDTPLLATPANAGHDPEAVRRAIASLRPKAETSALARRRLEQLQKRLDLIEESQTYEAVLKRITGETERYRKLDAPAWALAQRDCMARLRNWAYYWIDHQQPDGQFGGRYGDDVELVCGWPVLVLGQDDDKVRRSLTLLADGVWNSRPFLERFGYDRLSDVEHAAENTSYSQPRMVVIDHTNPKWLRRCRRTVETMAEHFLSRNEKGHLQFRSDYFGFDPRTLKPVTREKDRPFDIAQSSKALKPAMYAVWATNDPEARRVMLEYGRTWVEAARSADGANRIAGLLPSQVQWPSGDAIGTHSRMSSMRATLFHLIGCYHVSGDRQFLEPIRALLEKSLLDWSVKGIPSAGTLGELVDEDYTGLFEQLALVAVLYRQATGDKRFDEPLRHWAERIRDSLVDGVKSYVLMDRDSERLWHVDRPLTVGAYLESRCAVGSQLYMGWDVTGDEDYLARLGWNLSSCLNDKWGAFTYWFYDKSEPRVTSNDHPAHKLQTSESALCQMYLGGPAPVEAVWPRIAVTWKDVGEDFAALVRRFDARSLEVHVYNFDDSPRTITANLWELAPGAYEAVVAPVPDNEERTAEPIWRQAFDVPPQAGMRKPTPVRFRLPPRTLTCLTVRPKK